MDLSTPCLKKGECNPDAFSEVSHHVCELLKYQVWALLHTLLTTPSPESISPTGCLPKVT